MTLFWVLWHTTVREATAVKFLTGAWTRITHVRLKGVSSDHSDLGNRVVATQMVGAET